MSHPHSPRFHHALHAVPTSVIIPLPCSHFRSRIWERRCHLTPLAAVSHLWLLLTLSPPPTKLCSCLHIRLPSGYFLLRGHQLLCKIKPFRAGAGFGRRWWRPGWANLVGCVCSMFHVRRCRQWTGAGNDRGVLGEESSSLWRDRIGKDQGELN